MGASASGDHRRECRPGPHKPQAPAQDRDDQQDRPHPRAAEPTPEELAEKLGMPLEKVRKLRSN